MIQVQRQADRIGSGVRVSDSFHIISGGNLCFHGFRSLRDCRNQLQYQFVSWWQHSRVAMRKQYSFESVGDITCD